MNGITTAGGGLAWMRSMLGQSWQWVRANLRTTLIMSAIAFVFGWAWNTYVMAVDGGTSPDGDTISTAADRPANSLFWLLFFGLLSGLISYGWQRGWRNMGNDLAGIPRRFGHIVGTGKNAAFSMLLWGISLSLIISTVISSAVSLALGLVLITLSATPVGVVLNFALVRVWKGLSGLVSPSESLIIGGPFMVTIGEGIGLLFDWFFGSFWIGLAAGIVCVALSMLLARSAPTAGTAVIVLFGVMLFFQILFTAKAFADDGGWQECVTPDGGACSEAGLAGIGDWLQSDGAGPVIVLSTAGGGAAAIGTAAGAAIGSVAASTVIAGAAAMGAAGAGTLGSAGAGLGTPGTSGTGTSGTGTSGTGTSGTGTSGTGTSGTGTGGSGPSGTGGSGTGGTATNGSSTSGTDTAGSGNVPSQGGDVQSGQSQPGSGQPQGQPGQGQPAQGQEPSQPAPGQQPGQQAPGQQAPGQAPAGQQTGQGIPSQPTGQDALGTPVDPWQTQPGQHIPPQPIPNLEDYLPDAPDRRKQDDE